jgi:hypothetical protein
MKFLIIVLSIIAFIFCLGIGLYAGTITSPTITPVVSGSTPKTPTTTASTQPQKKTSTPQPRGQKVTDQRILIIIQTDDLLATKPRLVGLWLAIYKPAKSFISFLPIYPSAGGKESATTQALADTFSFSHEGKFSVSFLQSLDSLKFPYNGFIVTDKEGLARVVDGLQGIDLGDGKTVSQMLAVPWENPSSALSSQNKILNSFCRRWSRDGNLINWLPILANPAPSHLRTDLSFSLFTNDWLDLTGGPSPLKCEIPGND